MISSIKPLNLLLADAYALAIIYLLIKWSVTECNTYSNVWEFFYYLTLVLRLIADEMESNSIISNKIYWAFTLFTSFGVLMGMGIYEMVTIYTHPEDFSDPKRLSPCFQNRILFVAECIIGFVIIVKDVLVLAYEIRARPSTLV